MKRENKTAPSSRLFKFFKISGCIYYTLFHFFYPLSLLAEDIHISASIQKNIVTAGKTFSLSVEISWAGDGNQYLLKSFKLPDCHLLKILASSQRAETRVYPGNKETKEIIDITLQAEKKGEGRIGYCSLKYQEKDSPQEQSIRTEPIDITIISRKTKNISLIKYAGTATFTLIILGILAIFFIDKKTKK